MHGRGYIYAMYVWYSNKKKLKNKEKKDQEYVKWFYAFKFLLSYKCLRVFVTFVPLFFITNKVISVYVSRARNIYTCTHTLLYNMDKNGYYTIYFHISFFIYNISLYNIYIHTYTPTYILQISIRKTSQQ